MGKQKKQKAVTKNLRLSEKISHIFYHWVWRKSHMASITAGHYHIKCKISEGSFGKVMLAMNIYTKVWASRATTSDTHTAGKVYVAAKLERQDTVYAQLKTEFTIYELLGNIAGISKIFYYGPCNREYNALVMELLGPDLQDLLDACKPNFSYKTVLSIGMQSLKLLEFIHNKNIIYRDIKPENFCIGYQFQGNENVLHIIDFGLAKICDETNAGDRKPLFRDDYIVGTARYMSANAHRGIEQSQRDDLESLGYMLVYLCHGRLPWMGLADKGTADNNYRAIGKLKMSIKSHALCPEYPALAKFVDYSRALAFNERPNYEQLQGLLRDEFETNGFKDDGLFDWTSLMTASLLRSAIQVDPDD